MKYMMLLFLLSALPGSAMQQSSLPPGSIDGQATPELIPDVVAFRLFFTAVAEDAQPSATQIAKQNSKLCGIHFSDADKSIFVQALPDFKSRMVPATAAPMAASLDDIAQATVNLLQTNMSPDGFQRLQAYVRIQKKRMKRFPYPSMGSRH